MAVRDVVLNTPPARLGVQVEGQRREQALELIVVELVRRLVHRELRQVLAVGPRSDVYHVILHTVVDPRFSS